MIYISLQTQHIQQTHNKMPKTIIERIENFIVEPFKGTLPKHIKQFCSGRQTVTRKIVDNLKEAGEIVLKEIKGINTTKLRYLKALRS